MQERRRVGYARWAIRAHDALNVAKGPSLYECVLTHRQNCTQARSRLRMSMVPQQRSGHTLVSRERCVQNYRIWQQQSLVTNTTLACTKFSFGHGETRQPSGRVRPQCLSSRFAAKKPLYPSWAGTAVRQSWPTRAPCLVCSEPRPNRILRPS